MYVKKGRLETKGPQNLPKAIVEGERPTRAQGTHTGMTVPADTDYNPGQGNHTHLDTGGHIHRPPPNTHTHTPGHSYLAIG